MIFPQTRGEGWFGDDSSLLHLLCTLFLLLLHQLHLRSSGIRSQTFGIPALKHIWSPSPCHRTKFSLLSQASSLFCDVVWFSDLISHQFLISHLALIILSWTHCVSTMGPLHLLFSASALPRSLPSSLPCFIHVYSQVSSQRDLLSLHYLKCMIPAHNPPFPYLGFLLWSLPDFVIFISPFPILK